MQMSRQPAPNQLNKTQPNKQKEVYEQLEMQEECSQLTINRPNCPEDSSQLAGRKTKKGNLVVIALVAVFLVFSALIVSLAAVIIYSPLVNGGDTESSASTVGDNLLSRIQQLEGRVEQLQAMQGTNQSFELLQESLESLEAQVQQQSNYNGTVSSQFLNVHNLMQTLSLILNNLRQDLDRLRTVNLFEGCIEETRSCVLGNTLVTTFADCFTSEVTINPEVSLSPFST